jgi:mannitol/fructose-specific phosphotransferase system IIA component (Ntr-type)
MTTVVTLADFTTSGMILPELRGQDVAGVIQELSQAMHRAGRISDVLPFYHATLNRELLVSTDMEGGIAFPHGRVTNLSEVCFAYGRTREALPWGGSGRPVRMVFLLAVPATDWLDYLALVSSLARLAKQSALVETLAQAQSLEAIIEVFRKIKIPLERIPVRRESLTNQR